MKVVFSSAPFHESELVNKLVKDYLNEDAFFSRLIAHSPIAGITSDWLKARKDFPHEQRVLLKEALVSQYERIGLYSNDIAERIALLEQPNTFTVCTGQQLGVLLGPLYTTLKILSTFSLSAELKKRHPDKNFIPVFWMASEDHDIDEIKSVRIGENTYTWNTKQSGPSGRLRTEGIAELIDSISELKYRPDLKQMLHDAYEKKNLADATQHLCHALFNSLGVLVINPDEPALKKAFASIVFRDITEQNSFRESRTAIAHLEQRYKIQLNGRPINFFYQTNTSRERIEILGESYSTESGQKRWSKGELAEELNTNPAAFSPNAMMRPLYQEFILPNLAYFGGAAEVSYWLELKPAFDFYNIPFPAVLLRNSAFALDTVNLHRCSNAGFGTFELIRPLPELEKELILRENPHDIQLKEEQDLLERLRNALVSKAESVGSGLPEASASFIKRMEHNLARLQKKFLREAKRNESDGLKQLRLARAEVFPGGSFQERKLSLFAYLALTHEYTFIEELSKAQAPFGNTLACIENK